MQMLCLLRCACMFKTLVKFRTSVHSICLNFFCMPTIILWFPSCLSASPSIFSPCNSNTVEYIFVRVYFLEKPLQICRSFHLHAPQKMVVFKVRASVCSCHIVQMCNLALCGPTAAWALLTRNKLYCPCFVGPQYPRVRVWSGPVDCQWCCFVSTKPEEEV